MLAARGDVEAKLYARCPDAIRAWLAESNIGRTYDIARFDDFSCAEHFDAILNFVGVGDPAKLAALGGEIFDITSCYDEMALAYLRDHPRCKYIFMSSGAAYGGSFKDPAGDDTSAVVPINYLRPENWYGVAKLHAECRHRAMSSHAIVDLRVFNYFSHTQDLTARFLMTDILRAIRDGSKLVTSAENIVRDYIGPRDFFALVSLFLDAPFVNAAFDCYTRSPVDKMSLLNAMQVEFGLTFELTEKPAGVNGTGGKQAYYSTSRAASSIGYRPEKTALETVLDESRLVLR